MRKSDCPIHFALEVFGDKWSLLIIRDLMFKGKCNYGEFIAADEGISSNILATRLRSLEENNLIAKVKDPSNMRKKIYSLTDKGWDLLPMMIEIVLWSATHDAHTGTPAEFVQQATHNRKQFMRAIRAQKIRI